MLAAQTVLDEAGGRRDRHVGRDGGADDEVDVGRRERRPSRQRVLRAPRAANSETDSSRGARSAARGSRFGSAIHSSLVSTSFSRSRLVMIRDGNAHARSRDDRAASPHRSLRGVRRGRPRPRAGHVTRRLIIPVEPLGGRRFDDLAALVVAAVRAHPVGSLRSWQLGQTEVPGCASASCARALVAAGPEWRRFGFGMVSNLLGVLQLSPEQEQRGQSSPIDLFGARMRTAEIPVRSARRAQALAGRRADRLQGKIESSSCSVASSSRPILPSGATRIDASSSTSGTACRRTRVGDAPRDRPCEAIRTSHGNVSRQRLHVSGTVAPRRALSSAPPGCGVTVPLELRIDVGDALLARALEAVKPDRAVEGEALGPYCVDINEHWRFQRETRIIPEGPRCQAIAGGADGPRQETDSSSF